MFLMPSAINSQAENRFIVFAYHGIHFTFYSPKLLSLLHSGDPLCHLLNYLSLRSALFLFSCTRRETEESRSLFSNKREKALVLMVIKEWLLCKSGKKKECQM